MIKRIVLHLPKAVWVTLVVALVLIAIVLSAGRLFMPRVDDWREDVRAQLSAILEAPVALGKLRGRFIDFNPAVEIESVTIYQSGNPEQTSAELHTLVLELDSFGSLVNRQPVFRKVSVASGQLKLQGGPGTLALAGAFGASSGTSADAREKNSTASAALYDLIARQRLVDVGNLVVTVAMPNGQTQTATIDRLVMTGPPEKRRLSAVIDTGAKQPLTLSINMVGMPREWPNVLVNGYIKVPQSDIQPWLALLPESLIKSNGLGLTQLRAGAQLWLSYTPFSWKLRGSLQAQSVQLDQNGQSLAPLTNLSANVALTYGRRQPLRVWLEQCSFQFAGHAYPQSNLYLALDNKSDTEILLAADTVHLQPLAEIAKASNQLPERWQQVLSTLAPRGTADHFLMGISPNRVPFDFKIRADLRAVGVDHWRGAPSGERINGQLMMTADAGVLDLNSPGFTLGLDNVFDDVWVFDRARGQLYWRKKEDTFTLRSNQFSLTGGEGETKTRFRLDIPFSGDKAIWMALETGMTDGNISYTGKYLPVKKNISPTLASWLNTSLAGGSIEQGAFIFNGPLTGPAIANSTSWGLFFDVNQANIVYSPRWPAIRNMTGTVSVDQDQVLVTAKTAQLYDSAVSDLRAHVPNILGKQPLVLAITGQVHSNGTDGQRLLKESPLATVLDHAADNWQISGPLLADVDLKIPLHSSAGEDVRVTLHLDNNSLTIPEARLHTDQLRGLLHYSSAKGVYGNEITGHLFNKPFHMDIRSSVQKKSLGARLETQLKVAGHIAVPSVSNWLGFDLSPYLAGEVGYRANVKIGGGVRIDITSPLTGITSTMPAPLALDGGKKQLAITLATAKDQPLTIQARLDQHNKLGLATQLGLNDHGSIDRVGIHINGGRVILPKKGVFIIGKIDTLALQPWHAWWKQQRSALESSPSTVGNSDQDQGADREGSLLSEFHVRDLQVKHLFWGKESDSGSGGRSNRQESANQYGKELLAGARINVDKQSAGWQVEVFSPKMTGSAYMPNNGNKPIQINIGRLLLPDHLFQYGSAEGEQQPPVTGIAEDDLLASVEPSSLPAMEVVVKELVYAEQRAGQVQFSLKPTKQGVTLDNFTGNLGSAGFTGHLNWILAGGRHQTQLTGTVTGRKLEKTLRLLALPELIQAKRFTATTKFSWDGSPAGVSLGALHGGVSVNVRDGRLNSGSSTGAGALRLFGVLNLDSITRRLRLDFSDLFSSGMAFDQMKGEVGFNKGQVTLLKPVVTRGPSSDLKLSGQLNTQQQALDLGLIVTLPVTQNIAVVSLLLGQPYIAGAAYLFDKLLGSKMEQFASLRYEISGSFDNPEVKLDRLFSNRVKKSKKS